MLRIRVSTIVLSICFASLAWGQQSDGIAINNWSEFTRTNMHRWNEGREERPNTQTLAQMKLAVKGLA